ncbi:hypothetical protein C0J52_21137 [Blattella germanica]|nr:hypothetical protein C0J52_21137 [Blattella germanica]
MVVYIRNPDISECIKISRLRWAGHLMRMKEEKIPRSMITLQLGSKRGRGRPRLQRIVNGDAMALGMRNWKAEALDQNFLRRPRLVNELLPHRW